MPTPNQSEDIDHPIGDDVLAETLRLCRQATPADQWQDECQAVAGDVNRRLSPDSPLKVNTTRAWAVGPICRSRRQAGYDAALASHARLWIERYARRILELQAAKEAADTESAPANQHTTTPGE
jgi:hypothetical protein